MSYTTPTGSDTPIYDTLTAVTPVADTVGDPMTPGTIVTNEAPADPTPASDPAPADPTPASDPTPDQNEEPDHGVIFEDVTTTTTETKIEEEEPSRREYSVQPGDTLSGIATRLRLEGGATELYRANRNVIGSDPNSIFPGQVLVLP